MAIEGDFTRATAQARTLPAQPDEVLLQLYGLFKQATAGDAGGDEPGTFDFVGRAKYDAWATRRGMSREQAMADYVALVERLASGG